MTIRSCLCLCLLTIVACPLIPARAEEPLPGGSPDEQELLFGEIPSVYTASKYEQKATEAPSSVSVVTAAEIKKYGYRTLADILGSLRGLYLNYDRNYHYLGVRGFLRPGDYNTRVLILVDGISTNESVYYSASVGNEFSIDVSLIDRVEMVRGPSSSIYGTSAFFGVVNVITKQGRDFQGLGIEARGGSFDSYGGPLTYGRQLSSGLEFLVSADPSRSNGNSTLYFEDFDDPATNNGIARGADDDDFSNLFAKVSYGEFTFQADFVSRDKTIPTAPWDTVFNDPGTQTTDSQYHADLKYERDFDIHTHLMTRINYNRYYYDADYVYDWADPGDPPYLVTNRDKYDARWWGAEIQFNKKVGDNHRTSLGADYRLNVKQHQLNLDEEVYLDDDRDLNNWGIFAQDEYRLSPKFLLNGGARYDHYESFGATVNPRLALIFTPSERSTFKLLYGRAFRAPSVYELYYHDGGWTQKASLDLDPETIDTYEVIWEGLPGDMWRVSTSLFVYEIQDLITQEIDPADDLLVFRNVDQVSATGFECEVERRWAHNVESRLSYTHQSAEDDTTGTRLTNSPRHLASLHLLAPLLRDKLTGGFEFLYNSKRKTVAGDYSDDMFVTNLTLFSQPMRKNLELSASIYNLFDQEFFLPGGPEHVQSAIEQDGRTYRIKVGYLF